MSKELPIFSGNPEDWPLFISSYKNTTEACGYSEAENLARLQRCLKGHALESVRSRLLLPAGVPQVIATLKILYGRPELLIHTLLQKIREVAAPKHDRLDTLIGFGMAVQNLCDHLEAGGQEAQLNNPMLLFELVEKLPANMKLDWSLYKQRCGGVNLQVFAQYMSTLVRAATDVTLDYGPKPSQSRQQREKSGKDKHFCGAHSMDESTRSARPTKEFIDKRDSTPGPVCLICKDPKHRVKDCDEFGKKAVDERWKVIQQYSLCRNCLGAHGRRPCKISKRCEVEGCQMKHHSMLHSNTVKSDNSENKASGSRAVTNYHTGGKASLFRILPVTLHGNNRSMSVFAFLDDGSERTLVEEDVVKKLGVEGEHLPLCLQWTANVKRTEAGSQRIGLEIAGRLSSAKHKLVDVRTVSKLDLPRQSIQYAKLAETFPYLRGLPVQDYEKAVPCILIGNDNAHVTATLKLREGQPGEPVAAKTRLGWTIYGKNSCKSESPAHIFHICECYKDESLHDLVTQFFSVESLGITETACPESEKVQRANQILRATTKRMGPRFETGLIWKYDKFEFPDSYAMAVRRLECLERRIRSDPVIGESVMRQMREYQIKGYIHKATEEELEGADPRRVWYLPLGVALNPKKPTKVRIFCDAAAKVDGISLNTMLLKGPDLLNSLLAVLFGFREKKIALCADLKEMFHQVQIRKEDRHAQRLLWREDSSHEPDIYLMDVATFGAACSPCSAQFVKNLNAAEHAESFPAAVDAILRKHYVDDYLDSADNVDEAVKLALEIKHVHSLGGFQLRNWLSNSQDVLTRVGDNDSVAEKSLQLDKDSVTERVLGVFWKLEKDVFTFSSAMSTHEERPTKRSGFLHLHEDQWPTEAKIKVNQTTEELRSCLVHQEVIAKHQVKWDRFSQWSRLWHASAYIYRYVTNLRRRARKENTLGGPLRQEELAAGENIIWRWIQSDVFPDEVATLSEARGNLLKRQAKLEKTSKLRKLSAYMDAAGVVRMESRIAAATFASFDTRFPIILPKGHIGTRLMIGWYHQKYLHGNAETVVNEMRQRFYVPNLRAEVRKVKKMCQLCRVKQALPVVPRMALLPTARLKPYERPFSYVGVDYFGPIAVRVNRTTAKRWIALFTCLTIRAVHLELVHTLSAESCKMAFRRFIARRGAPAEIYSDRGTNFVGSSKELRREMEIIEGQLEETFTSPNTKWVFNPGSSSYGWCLGTSGEVGENSPGSDVHFQASQRRDIDDLAS
ncbi:uncharacterized protein LOC134222837 [Armigeres subalbatus]|uniref:uncharacterized protein LOC134222837 n=1 Tax=Armigeres subalbatus TaxID=124917 RepID=UPI002ED64A93